MSCLACLYPSSGSAPKKDQPMPGMRGDWHVPFVRYVYLEMMGTVVTIDVDVDIALRYDSRANR